LIPATTISLHGRVLDSSTPPAYQVTSGPRVISLFGEVEFIVDYYNLRLYPAQRDDVENILLQWASEDDLAANPHQLTELEGRYVIVVEENGEATYLYTCNDCNFLLYSASREEDSFLSTDWVKVLQWLGQVTVSEVDLGLFMSREWTEISHTLFEGMYVLRPYALYRVLPGKLSLLKHAFPGLHTVEQNGIQQYEISDYVQALGAYNEHFDSFALAFSGGTDSRVLACAYQEKLGQLLTIMYQPPFMSYLRYQSGQASQKLAQAQGIKYTPLIVDWNDSEALTPYMEHFAIANPFSTHLSAHYYHLTTHVDNTCDALMIGTFSDIIWGWGLNQIYFSEKQSHSTSGHSIRLELTRMFKRRKPRLIASYAVNRYAVRWAMVKSFDRPRFRSLINHYQPMGSQFDELWRYPYKAFALRRYVEWSPVAETILWSQAGRFAGKRILLPYTSPLALHVSSQIPRHNIFDPKSPLRSIYSEFDASAQDKGPQYPADQVRPPYTANLFHQPGVREWNQQFVDSHSSKPFQIADLPQRKHRAGFYHLHLNYLFRHVEEQIMALESR